MRIAFTCGYTPLPLLDAAGAEPYRILPLTAAPERAGRVLHDNLCPHVKRVLDRVLGDDLPPLDGAVLVHSCDAMRRLADAWRHARPGDRVALVDLPVAPDEPAVRWYASELGRLRAILADWSGAPVPDDRVDAALDRWNRLVERTDAVRERLRRGTLPGGAAAAQRVWNETVARPIATSVAALEALLAAPEPEPAPAADGVPALLFGNVLPDPEVFALLARSGVRVVADDLCTGSRPFHRVERAPGDDPLLALARATLTRPGCARTVSRETPGDLGARVVRAAAACGARAVVGHVAKFCDPYLARLPGVRAACRAADLPLLVLEGDCTLRSVGQQATRLEAFVEMVGGAR